MAAGAGRREEQQQQQQQQQEEEEQEEEKEERVGKRKKEKEVPCMSIMDQAEAIYSFASPFAWALRELMLVA